MDLLPIAELLLGMLKELFGALKALFELLRALPSRTQPHLNPPTSRPFRLLVLALFYGITSATFLSAWLRLCRGDRPYELSLEFVNMLSYADLLI